MLRAFVVGLLSLALAAGAAPAVSALTAWLSDADIRAALAGKTIEGRYADGTAFTENYGDDGRLWYLESGRKIFGRWSVTAGTLCTIYDIDPTGGCFRVSKVGKNCFEFYFAARTEAAAPGGDNDQPKWTARGAVSGEPEACQDEVSV